MFKPTLSVIQLHSEFQKCSPDLGSSHVCIWWPSTSISKPAEWRRGSRGDCVSLKEALATPAHILPARTESRDQNSLQAWLWPVFLHWILLLIERVSDCWAQLVTMRSPYRLWNESCGQGKSFEFYSEGCRNRNCVSKHNFCVKNRLEGASWVLRWHSSPSETKWLGLGDSSKRIKGVKWIQRLLKRSCWQIVMGARAVDSQGAPGILACGTHAAEAPGWGMKCFWSPEFSFGNVL